MSRIITKKGDNFDSLARRAYGDDLKAAQLVEANPGLVPPFEAGVSITVPDDGTQSPATTVADNPDELAVLIGGKRFRLWTNITLTRQIDTMDTAQFAAPFDPEDENMREMFRPLLYPTTSITIGGLPLFSGTLVSVNPELTSTSRAVAASCYSLPGVLGDCTSPATTSKQWDGVGLKTIAADVCKPFGLRVVFEANDGAVFERVGLEINDKPLQFLIKLAQQRGLLISSTERGELLFTKAVDPGKPVVRLFEGEPPLLSVAPTFGAQGYYSEITGIGAVFIGLKGGQLTVRNPRLQGVIRPFTFEIEDTLDADLQAACSAKIGRMFATTVEYSVVVATWRDPQGELWRPNTTVVLNAPGAMVYGDYELLIRSVSFSRTVDSGNIATLSLILPEAYNSKTPERLPWD